MKKNTIKCHPEKLQKLIDTVIECNIPVVIPGAIFIDAGESSKKYIIDGKMKLISYTLDIDPKKERPIFAILPSLKFKPDKIFSYIKGEPVNTFHSGILSGIKKPGKKAVFKIR